MRSSPYKHRLVIVFTIKVDGVFIVTMLGILVAGVVLVIVAVAWYYRRNKHIPPTLYYVDSDLHRYVITSRDRFTSPYRPPFWLQNNHIHTIVATLFPKAKLRFERKYLDMDDGGAVALDFVVDNEDYLTESSTVLVVVPGMTAGREDMGDICKMATERGYRVVVYNKRGHGDTVLVTPKLIGFGDTRDLRHCVEHLHEKFPLAKIVGVGSSAGSGILASYLGDYGADCILTTGVGICPGYEAKELFINSISAVYNFLLLKSLKKIVKKHSKVLSQAIDVKAACGATKLVEFDTLVYCKIYGYRDITEYWKHHHPMRNVQNSAVPFMAINSMDDPLCTANYIPFQMFKENPDWLLVTTDKGGHCGFIDDKDWKPWSDKLALDYIDAVLEYQVKSC